MGQPRSAPFPELQSDLPFLLKNDGRGNVALGAPLEVLGPFPRQIESAIDQVGASSGGVGKEDADLTILDLAQSSAPLARDPAALGPLLGESAGIEDQDGLGFPTNPADMAPQLHQDRIVVPLARADEELDVLVLDPGAVSDRFSGLALQAADEATNDQVGVVALLPAIESAEITAEEPPQAVTAAPNGLGCEDRILEKGLGVGMVEQGHRAVSYQSQATSVRAARREQLLENCETENTMNALKNQPFPPSSRSRNADKTVTVELETVRCYLPDSLYSRLRVGATTILVPGDRQESIDLLLRRCWAGRDHASSRAVGPHAVQTIAVGDDRGPEAAAGAGTTTASGRAVPAELHQPEQLEGFGQGDEWGIRGRWHQRIRLVQPPGRMSALDRITGA